MGHATGHNLTLDFSRMFRKSGQGPVETLSNIAVFVPFGFFLGEWLASSNRMGSWRRVGLVALAAFGLSLCIECLQLVLHVDYEWWRGQMDRDAGQTCCLFAFCLSLRIEVLQLILLLGQGYGFCVGYGRGVGEAWMSARVRKVAEGDENRTIGRS